MASRKATPAEIRGRNSTRYLKLKARYRASVRLTPCRVTYAASPSTTHYPVVRTPTHFEVDHFPSSGHPPRTVRGPGLL